MQRIERYGVIALVFLLVTILAVSLWGEGQGKEMLSKVKDRASGMTHLLAKQSAPASEPSERLVARAGSGVADRGLPLGDTSEPAPRKHGRKGGLRREEKLEDAFVPLEPRPTTKPVPTPVANLSTPAHPEPVVARSSSALRSSAPVHERGGPAVPVESRTYVVRAGDTLSVIAQRELGTCKRWTEIQRLNGNLDPAKLRAGMKLKLPAGGSVASARTAPAATPAHAPAAGGSYVVRRGDTLSVISQRELGTSTRWREIVALNPGLDPNRLAVGARLTLPANGRASALRGEQVAALTPSERGSRVR